MKQLEELPEADPAKLRKRINSFTIKEMNDLYRVFGAVTIRVGGTARNAIADRHGDQIQ